MRFKLLIKADNAEYQLLPSSGLPLPDELVREERSYRLRLVPQTEGEDLRGYHLFLGDVDLGVGGLERNGHLSWNWEVRDYVGEVTVSVERDEVQMLPAQEIVINPNLSKLTREQFEVMVNDITREAAVAYSLSPATERIDLGQRREAFNLAQLEYVRQRIKALQRAVEAIARRPRRALVEEKQIADLDRARGPDERSVTWLLSHPRELLRVEERAVPAGARDLHRRMGGHLPRRLQVSRRRVTHDVYENQLVKHFLTRLYVVLRHTRERLEEDKGDFGLDEPIRHLAGRRLGELEPYRRIIYNLLGLDFLSEVSPLRQHRPVTPTLRKDPHYARFYTLYRQFNRAITPFDGAPFRLSVEKTWQLYEYWCFFQVLVALRQAVEDPFEFDARRFLRRHADRVSMALQEAQVDINHRVRVHFQKSYGYYRSNGAGVGTYSHRMRPDISIELLDGAGGIERIILLDPKYRVSRPSIDQAMDELHRYKDAIVGPDRRRLVHTALALCPNSERAKGLYFEHDYVRIHGLGALVLRPGDENGVETLAGNLERLMGIGTDA
jgi:predicted component of viral defense system (DUF524 family)